MFAENVDDASDVPFELEFVSQLSEADYVRWEDGLVRPTRPARARMWRWALTIVAVACFASWYTVVLGVVLGLIALAVWTSPRWMASTERAIYRKAEYLHGPIIYGVSSRGLWFRGGALRAECTWDGLAVFGEQDGFLWLAPAGMPRLILPIARLSEAGIYERVRALAARHAVEYGSPAAVAGRRTEVAPATSYEAPSVKSPRQE